MIRESYTICSNITSPIVSRRFKPVRHLVNHRPVPVPVPVPHKVYNPVPVYREVYSTAINRVPVPVRVPRPVPVAVPVDVARPVPVPVPVNVLKPVPVENHHLLVRKVGVPVSAAAGYGFHRG